MLVIVLLIVAQIAVVAFLIFSPRKPKEPGPNSALLAEDNSLTQDLQNTVEELKKELSLKNSKIEDLDKELASAHKHKEELQEEVNKYKKSIYSLQTELDQLRKRNMQLEEGAEERTRADETPKKQTKAFFQEVPQENVYKLSEDTPSTSIKPEEAENLKEFLEAKENPPQEESS